MAFLTAKTLPRRTVLRGIGTTLALPFLDAMFAPFSLRGQTAAKPVHRFQAFYVPNGMAMEYWTPTGEGTDFQFSPIQQALDAVPRPNPGAVGTQGKLELHPCRRVRIVSDWNQARRTERSRDHRRRLDGSTAGEAFRPGHAVGIARAVDGSSRTMPEPAPGI